MNEDEYLEDDQSAVQTAYLTSTCRSISAQEVIQSPHSPEEMMDVSSLLTPQGSKKSDLQTPTLASIDEKRPTPVENGFPEEPEKMDMFMRVATTAPTSVNRGGRKRQIRIRKSVARPILNPIPTITMDDSMYFEELESGWARCYPDYKILPKEDVIEPMDDDTIKRITASANHMIDLIKSKEKKKERINRKKSNQDDKESKETETVVERTKSGRSIDRTVKSSSRAVSETPSTSFEKKRPLVQFEIIDDENNLEENKTQKIVQTEESKEERKARRKKEKEHKQEELQKENEEKTNNERRKQEEKERKEEEERKKYEIIKHEQQLRQEEEGNRKGDRKRRREEEKETEMKSKHKEEPVDITDWNEERIVNHFGLKQFVLKISLLSQSAIDEALAFQSLEKNEMKIGSPRKDTKKSSKVFIDSDLSSSPLSAAASSSADITDNKIKKQSEPHVSVSPSSPFFQQSPSPNARNADDVRKKPKTSCRKCMNCHRNLHDCIDQWYKELGVDSQYCSVGCIDDIVERIKEHEKWNGEARIAVVGSNDIIRRELEAPTLDQLSDFIRHSASFIPLSLSEKMEELEMKEAELKAKAAEKASKFMSRESDILRGNLRQKIGDELFKSGRLFGKFTVADCKKKGTEIEHQLFKASSKDVNGTMYRFFAEKLKPLFSQYRNFASKILADHIIVLKLVSVQMEELEEFAKINNCTLDGEEVDPTAPLKLPTITAEALAASQEISKHIKTVSNPKGRIPKKPKGQFSTLDVIFGDGTDTTSQHNSHFFDSNCSICANQAKAKQEKEKKEQEERDRFREEERLKKEKRHQNRQERMVKKNYNREKKRDQEKVNDHSPALNLRDPLGLSSSLEIDNVSDDDYAGGGISSPERLPSSPEVRQDETWRKWVQGDEIWRGQVVMGSLTFVTSLKAISNPVAFEMRDQADLPVSFNVKGRIKQLVVFEYLRGLRTSKMDDVIVLKLERPLDPKAEKQFTGLYHDMIMKDRYEVIDFSNSKRIRDGYFLPLPANEEAPAVLLPWNGPGFPEKHPELILCVIVRRQEILENVEMPVNLTEVEREQSTSPLVAPEVVPGPSEERPVENQRFDLPAPVNEGDFLIHPKFFETLKKLPPQPPSPQRFTFSGLPELINFINETDNPRVVKEVVQPILNDPSLDERDREIIRVTVMNKIRQKKSQKKNAPPPLIQPSIPPNLPPSELTTFQTSQLPYQKNDEYAPDQPTEVSEDENNESEERPPSRPLSASNFDAGEPSSFLDTTETVLSRVGLPHSSEQSLFTNASFNVSSELATGPLFNNIPLPAAPNASAEVYNIPPPSERPPGGIPVIGASVENHDISEANSVEAMVGEDSPPDEEQSASSQVISIPPPVPPPIMHSASPYMHSHSHPSMFHQGVPSMAMPPMGLPPQMVGLPSMAHLPMVPPIHGAPPYMHPPMQPPMAPIPPSLTYPKKVMEIHGCVGFKGLAPSLGGKSTYNSTIDFFHGKATEKPTSATIPTIVIPAKALCGTRTINNRYDDDDNIPRTPTPEPQPRVRSGVRPGARPQVRPGARPGARVQKRPQYFQYSPDERERSVEVIGIEVEDPEVRRELPNSLPQESLKRLRLGKIPRCAPPSVINARIALIANMEGISQEAAEKIVREKHIMESDEEDSGSEAEDLAQTRGLQKVKVRPQKRQPGFAYEHSTGFVAVTKQKRALNVDYDEDGNEIVPDDVPSSDEELNVDSMQKIVTPHPINSVLPLRMNPPPSMDRTMIPSLISKPRPPNSIQFNTPSSSQSNGEWHEDTNFGEMNFSTWPDYYAPPPPSQQQSLHPSRGSFYPRGRQHTNRAPDHDHSFDNHFDDGFGYPPRGPPPPRGRGFRGKQREVTPGIPPQHSVPHRGSSHPRCGPPRGFFRGRGEPLTHLRGSPALHHGSSIMRGAPLRGNGPSMMPPIATPGHPYYDTSLRRGGSWSSRGNFNGGPPSKPSVAHNHVPVPNQSHSPSFLLPPPPPPPPPMKT